MRVYDNEFKEEAIKLSYELGIRVASEQLGVPGTSYTHGETEPNSMDPTLL